MKREVRARSGGGGTGQERQHVEQLRTCAHHDVGADVALDPELDCRPFLFVKRYDIGLGHLDHVQVQLLSQHWVLGLDQPDRLTPRGLSGRATQANQRRWGRRAEGGEGMTRRRRGGGDGGRMAGREGTTQRHRDTETRRHTVADWMRSSS